MLVLWNAPKAASVSAMSVTMRAAASALQPLRGIAINSASKIILVGDNGGCYHTGDRGSTIHAIPDCKIPNTADINAIACRSFSGHCIAISRDGYASRTTEHAWASASDVTFVSLDLPTLDDGKVLETRRP